MEAHSRTNITSVYNLLLITKTEFEFETFIFGLPLLTFRKHVEPFIKNVENKNNYVAFKSR